jgi:hypothetical protein
MVSRPPITVHRSLAPTAANQNSDACHSIGVLNLTGDEAQQIAVYARELMDARSRAAAPARLTNQPMPSKEELIAQDYAAYGHERAPRPPTRAELDDPDFPGYATRGLRFQPRSGGRTPWNADADLDLPRPPTIRDADLARGRAADERGVSIARTAREADERDRALMRDADLARGRAADGRARDRASFVAMLMQRGDVVDDAIRDAARQPEPDEPPNRFSGLDFE